MHHKFNNNNVNIEYNMIICSTSNIDLIQGVVGYGDPEGITDWRITNTASGSSGTLNILNSISQTSKFTILENGNVGISNINPASLLDVGGDVNITGVYKRNNRDVIGDTSNYVLSTSNILATRVLTEVGFGSNYTSRLNTALSTRIDNTSNYVLTTSNLLANRVSSQWTNISTGIHYTPTKITSSPSATTIGSTSNFIYQVFTYDKPIIEQKTSVSGWRLVRFLPPTATEWHPINDNLVGTTTYGTAYSTTTAWSIPFGTFDEFVFGTLNLQYWMQITKTEAIGTNYSGIARSIIKSSYSSTPYSAIQYNRSGVPEDPWFSIKDHLTGTSADQIVYGENSYAGLQTALVSVDGGMGVWVRNSADAQIDVSRSSYNVNFPENTLCDILIVGGGGAGGDSMGGGGGAGGVVYAVSQTLLQGTYIVKVGRGGIGGSTTEEQGTAGVNQDGVESSLMNSNGTSYISFALGGISQEMRGYGGGGGGVYYAANNLDGRNGGSGGGCSEGNENALRTPGSATQPATYWNGTAYVVGGKAGRQNTTTVQDYGAGGGGGLGTLSADYRNGNDGVAISITGTSQFYAAGGGAGQYIGSSTTAGLGGSGIGGNGRVWTGSAYAAAPRNVATSGTNGTGSGGGGTPYTQAPVSVAGSGGSGIVIIRYISNTNIGVGTANPASELHVYDDTNNNTILKIENNYIDPVVVYPNTSLGPNLPNTLYATVPSGVTTGTIGDSDRFYIFTTGSYTIPVPAGITFDLFMIGGGGSGGNDCGGGGGAGACITAFNQIISAGSYTITVGAGGVATTGSQTNGNVGGDTSLGSLYVAKGGGAGNGGGVSGGGGIGGCSGGSSAINSAGFNNTLTSTTNVVNGVTNISPSTTATYAVLGTIGGNAVAASVSGQFKAGGGGGIGVKGTNGTGSVCGTGGSGIFEVTINSATYNLRSYFTNNGTFGVQDGTTGIYYIGGGGGGGGWTGSTGLTYISGGKGGGGKGADAGTAVISSSGAYFSEEQATANTGSGGGGGAGFYARGGDGGSGLLIFRYRNIVGYTAVETLESSKYYRTLTFTHTPNYPENPANTSLLAWYRFNGDGLDYNPYSTKYNLTVNSGTPTYSSGTTADSFFQGRRYINTSAGSLRTTTLSLASRAFSVSAWTRKKISGGNYFVSQGTVFTTNTTVLLGTVGLNNSYAIAFHGNDLQSSTTYPSDTNTWVHVVYVVLPNYNRRIYRNGVLIASDSNTSAPNAAGDLKFGANYGNNALYENIDISDLRIYTNGLSATEVATLYNSYINLEITDNYAVNFNKSTTLLVNSVSKTVNGLYNLSMGHINSSMLPAAGQADTPLASTAITSVAIKYEYTNTSSSLPNLITVSGATSSIIGTTERAISFTYTSDSSGLTGQTLYSFTPTEDLWCDILVVGGGGGGGGNIAGGGGGGAVLFGTNLKINAGVTVSVKVAKGGTGATKGTNLNGTNGYDSTIIINSIEYIAKGGGGGGSRASGDLGQSGNAGGSGGGGSHSDNASYQGFGGVSNKNNYANFQSFGNNGGMGRPNYSGSAPTYGSGGGGGAGSVGSDFSYTTGGGNGGLGKEFISYFGTNVGHNGYFAGGGGGNTGFSGGNRGYGNGGLGLYGGGGNGGYDGPLEYSADDALINTGGGGGGAKYDGGTAEDTNGGHGGTGFVIIRYRRNRVQSAALELIRNPGAVLPNELVVTSATGAAIAGTTDRYISFPYTSDSAGLTGQTQYTLTTVEPLICDILVIGGGGGGGRRHGGGGGAGTLIYHKNITLHGTYTIRVGKGGQGCQSSGSVTANTIGYSSQFIKSDNSQEYLATGGGNGGAGTIQASTTNGGGTHTVNSSLTLNTGNKLNGQVISVVNKQYVNSLISPEGCRGNMGGIMTTAWKGGGGGGAGDAGMNHDEEATVLDGYGGLGLAIDITGTLVIYAGGGNGSDYYGSVSQVFNPLYPTIQSRGGGGFGSDTGTPQNGLDGTGGGGGGQGFDNVNGGNGGSGIVIIRYRKANANYKIGNYGGDFKIISSTPAADTDYIRITSAGSSIYNPTGSPQWSTTSDRRIKENIEKASYTKCYDNINKLELYRFNYIKDFNNINKDLKQLGYIAQEVNEIFPKAVTTQHFNNDNLSVPDLLTIDITQINYSLYGTVKKLIEMYSDIEKQITMLEKLLNIDTSTSNIDTSTSNLIITDISTSNLIITDISTSNLIITDISTSNLDTLDTSTSNLDTSTSNLIITDNSTSNLDTSTSNLIITDNSTSNLDTSTSNLIIIDTSTSNLETSTSNLIIIDNSTSNLTEDAS